MDKLLIDKILAGNLGAYKQLVQQHERLVSHMVSRVVGNEEDIKDVSQEVFIRIYQNLGKFNFQAKLSTWIAKIAYTTSLNYIGKKGRERAGKLDPTDIEFVDDLTPADILHAKNEAEFIRYQVSRLPLAYRTVLTLYHLNEFSYREIEEITGMPEGTVKTHLFRARKILKERLERYYKR
jgi:RNA polymerase sigma factor (sigma-70 family)